MNSPQDEPAIDSLLHVHAANGGAKDRQLCDAIFAATTRQEENTTVTPFPHSPEPVRDFIWLKVAAIVVAICGIGLLGLNTLRRPSNDLASSSAPETRPFIVIFGDQTANGPSAEKLVVDSKPVQPTLQSPADLNLFATTNQTGIPPLDIQTDLPHDIVIDTTTPSTLLKAPDEPVIKNERPELPAMAAVPSQRARGMTASSAAVRPKAVAIVDGSIITSADLAARPHTTLDVLIAEHLLSGELTRRDGEFSTIEALMASDETLLDRLLEQAEIIRLK